MFSWLTTYEVKNQLLNSDPLVLCIFGPCSLVSDPGAPTLWSRAVTDVCGVSLGVTRAQGRDHGDAGLLITADITQLGLLHHDLAAVPAQSVHLELDDDPPLLVQHLGQLILSTTEQ